MSSRSIVVSIYFFIESIENFSFADSWWIIIIFFISCSCVQQKMKILFYSFINSVFALAAEWVLDFVPGELHNWWVICIVDDVDYDSWHERNPSNEEHHVNVETCELMIQTMQILHQDSISRNYDQGCDCETKIKRKRIKYFEKVFSTWLILSDWSCCNKTASGKFLCARIQSLLPS